MVLTQAISATFSTPMTASTISNATFLLSSPGGTAVAGTVTYNAATSTANFVPSAALTANTTYVATITTGAQNLAGTALAGDYSWTFTTVPLVAPTVISTVPANGATNVALTQTLSATFSTPMTASTISNATFLLSSPGGTAVAGTVTYNAATSTASFVPSAALTANTTYVATITTGAQNLAGTGLASNYTWSFTTTAAAAAPTVTATVPANKATGVALNQVLSATFSTAMAPATINASTFTLSGPGGVAVAGTVTYSAASQSGIFTPNAALLAATTYVATITTGAQNTAGTALAANYVWTFTTVPAQVPPTVISTVPANGATGVLLTQAISATFSTAMNPATLNGSTFTVATSAGVAATGVISYSSNSNTATFTPTTNLMANATYVATITTGAQSAAGTALLANYVWVFRTVPALTPPTVISTNPADKAAGVAFNQSLAATFSEAINPATINASTYTVTAPGGVAVAGTVTYTVAGSVATFTPTAAFLPLTTYVATITTGVQDLAGTALAANYVWTFTTGAAPDTTRPIVIATIPINGATAVPFNQAISATFSKPMNPNTITTSSFTLALPGGAAVNGLVSYAAISNTATFTPMTNLLPSTTYTATITTLAADLAGNTLLTNYVWTFTTGPAPDTTRPTITLTNPVANASNVPLTQTVSATFSEAMDPLTINTATFTLTGSGNAPVAATVTYNAVTFVATLTPSLPLVAGTTYTATVSTGATDLAGNSLMAGSVPNPWTFTTGAIVVVPPVNLGTAQLFGGFGGGAGMTNMGTLTVVNGNIGTTGVSTLITGFHDNGPNCIYTETPLNIGYVNGSIVTSPPPPTVGCPTEGTALTMAQAAQASLDAQTAYAALVAFPNGQDVSTCAGCGGGQAGELGNRTLVAGVYKSAPGSYSITAGDLTLDAKGDPNAFWVFQMGTTFTVGSPQAHRSVLLVNGAQAKNVFWQVGTAATINGILGGGTMTGTIISQAGISVSTAGVAAVTTINGRALVITGPVTLVNTVINVPAP